jgi:Family of unknown function (DUF6343)
MRQPRNGREPVTARSPLRLRMVLAGFGFLVGLLGAAVAWWILQPRSGGFAVACLVLAAISLVDLGVVLARIRRSRPPQDS